MEDDNMKFVEFDKYCGLCKDKDTSPTNDPCNDCLAIGARPGTSKPEYFKEMDKYGKE